MRAFDLNFFYPNRIHTIERISHDNYNIATCDHFLHDSVYKIRINCRFDKGPT